MKAIDRNFTKIINGTTQFIIPVFQRDYSWTEANCDQLWRDIMKVAAAPSDRGHFLGPVVYIPTGASTAGFTQWMLIDGQQRVTTLILLLTALRDHITETGWEGSEDGPTGRRVELDFLKNLQERGSRQHKLVLRRHDQATLRALLDSTELPDPPSDRIRDNYDFFRERLRAADPKSRLSWHWSISGGGCHRQLEDQLKRAVADFLEAAANELGIQAEARTEVREIVGRPDVGILIGGLLCGHLETKAPGHTVNPRQFRGHDRTQWQKFQRLPNLIYTNGHEWRLYREGDAVGEVIRLDGDPAEVGADAVSEQNAQDLAQLLLAYYRWKPIVPNDPPGLARFLAPLTRLLRDDVHEALVRNAETLIGLRDELRAFLMPELTDDQFADAYAQTLTYAMLLARLDGAEDLSPRAAARTLRARNTLLERLLETLGQEEAYDDVRLGLEVLQRAIGAIDAASLRRPGRDLWLYFYENFLHAYDPDLARDYGVYYTPAQIVHCQVRLVSQLLRERFQRRFSFADEDVITLDPGAGTGTYLVETSRSIIWVLRKARNY